MSRSDEEYEFARKIIKRETKNPNVYSANRKEAVLNRVLKDPSLSDRAVNELGREFRKELGLK